jgi:hypothetical protein
MIIEKFELYCDNCSELIATLDNESERFEYLHSRGYTLENSVGEISYIEDNFFCSKECKKEYFRNIENLKEIIEVI